MNVDEMIQEAYLDSASVYTIDFNGSNLYRVATLSAQDFSAKHPEIDSDTIEFIAGAIYQKYKSFAKEYMRHLNEGK
jgi:hypothetical protein